MKTLLLVIDRHVVVDAMVDAMVDITVDAMVDTMVDTIADTTVEEPPSAINVLANQMLRIPILERICFGLVCSADGETEVAYGTEDSEQKRACTMLRSPPVKSRMTFQMVQPFVLRLLMLRTTCGMYLTMLVTTCHFYKGGARARQRRHVGPILTF